MRSPSKAGPYATGMGGFETRDLEAADLDAALHDLLGIELLLDLLVDRDTRGMDHRDVGVRDGGEAHVMAPAPVVQMRSFRGPRTMANANTLSFEYFRILLKSPPFMPPKVMPARAAQFRA